MDDIIHDFLIWLLQFSAISVGLLIAVHYLLRPRPESEERMTPFSVRGDEPTASPTPSQSGPQPPEVGGGPQ